MRCFMLHVLFLLCVVCSPFSISTPKASQKFDKTFLEQKVVETNHDQSEKQDIKTKNSGDVNQCCCLDIESNKQEEEIKDEVESKKDSQRDFVIKESASI